MAAAVLSRDFDLSRRQEYRYRQQAQPIGHPVAVSEDQMPITLDGSARCGARVARRCGRVALGGIVARTVKAYLAAREHC